MWVSHAHPNRHRALVIETVDRVCGQENESQASVTALETGRLKVPQNSRNVGDSGSMTAPVSGYVPGTGIMSGAKILSIVARTMVVPSGMLTVLDEYTKECLWIDVEKGVNSESVLKRLRNLFVRRGVPDHIRSDNGPEFTAERV